MDVAKPFHIPKKLVWEAYLRVKASGGGPGVDGQTVEAFEANLKDNLYRIWNRMSSGSYFPPPVKLVVIPKSDGRERRLGVPTVADPRSSLPGRTTETTSPRAGRRAGGFTAHPARSTRASRSRRSSRRPA